VTRFSRDAILGLDSEEASSSPKDANDGLNEVNEAILLAFSDERFSSVYYVSRIAGRIYLPRSTAYRRLVDSLHFTVRHQTSSLESLQALGHSEGKSS
jgi:hypothetical protein